MAKQTIGIWQYQKYFPKMNISRKISLGEGNTKLEKLDDIYFKCDYENPTGSVKDRSFAYQISLYKSKKVKKAVLSSSGNAGISAATYCALAGIDLTVFVSPRINRHKYLSLKKLSCSVITSDRPISQANLYAQNHNILNLRQSTDDSALVGYETITYEIFQNNNIDAIFIPVSSGTTFVGIGIGIQKISRQCSLHAVQTEAVCPMASLYDQDFTYKKKSLADALVARYTSREDEIRKIIKGSHGFGWVISDKEIIKAQQWLNRHNLFCSYEGGATLAAINKARQKGFRYQNPVCLLTGRKY